MIVPMKKISVLTLAENAKDTVAILAELGVLHIAQTELKDSIDRAQTQKNIESLQSALSILSSLKKDKKVEDFSEEKKFSAIEAAEQILKLNEEITVLSKQSSALSAKIEKISVWGNFNPQQLQNLREKGIYIYFCEKNKKDNFEKPKNTWFFPVSETKSKSYFLIVSQKEIPASELPLSDTDFSLSLSDMMAEKNLIGEKIHSASAKIAELAVYKENIKGMLAQSKEKYSFFTALDSMKGKGIVAALIGYIPENDCEKIREAALVHGWGLAIEDPHPDDRFVPTKIETPKIFRIIRPVFDFIGIEPGYDEVDVSVCFFFFFSIFFAMIIGDAGYGLLFLIAAIFAKFKFRENKELRLPLNLFIHLSVCTIVWGTLCGSWFSIDGSHLPPFLRGIDALSNPEIRDKTIQTFCFLLAGLHLSVGRIWRAMIISGLKSLGQIGWLAMIWMNFFLIKGLLVDGGKINFGIVLPLLGLALVLLVLFYVDWRQLGDIFNFPFAIIGSFSDVLSYIRLYAVGLASYYLALNVNQIGSMMMGNKFLFILGILVIVLGHSLNIVLCLLGVLVHGVRLNALEFSNHMELQWKGFKYNPFKISNKEIIKN